MNTYRHSIGDVPGSTYEGANDDHPIHRKPSFT
jgi:hypothetical protein